MLHCLSACLCFFPQDAISDKLGSFLQGVACFVGGMVRGQGLCGRRARGSHPRAQRGSSACKGVTGKADLPTTATAVQVVAFIRGWDLSLVSVRLCSRAASANAVCSVGARRSLMPAWLPRTPASESCRLCCTLSAGGAGRHSRTCHRGGRVRRVCGPPAGAPGPCCLPAC